MTDSKEKAADYSTARTNERSSNSAKGGKREAAWMNEPAAGRE